MCYLSEILVAKDALSLYLVQKVRKLRGGATQPGITPYGYGVMHLEPLFNGFPFDDLGGLWTAPQPRGDAWSAAHSR